jgi:hypothetical protein
MSKLKPAEGFSAISDDLVQDVYFESVDHGTGIREDDDVQYAVATIHGWTSAGSGIILTPSEIAEIRVRSHGAYTATQLSNEEFMVRHNMLPGLKYDRGRDGRRISGTYIMPLTTDSGTHQTDCEYIAFMNLEGTTAGNKIGQFGAVRLQSQAVDRMGNIHQVKLKDTGYADTASYHEYMIDGFVKGYKYLEDAIRDANEIREALAKIREALRAPIEPEETEFRDTPPRDAGY